MPNLTKSSLLMLLFACAASAGTRASADSPPQQVMLANVYHTGDAIDFSQYRVSEKYDGIRCLWNGSVLLTREGNRIAAPAWFTAGWPAASLDGELWSGRGQFERTVGIVRRETPDDAGWRLIRYMVFDAPSQPGSFEQRLPKLQALVAGIARPWVQMVDQFRVADAHELQRRLDQVIAMGGEGLVLHRGDSPYRGGRTGDLLKFKPYDDAEATVIEHLAGKGKYTGMVGALVVERPDGLRFRIGGGLTDAQRKTPPPIGSRITYTYNGFTRTGVPRFARFLRVRPVPY